MKFRKAIEDDVRVLTEMSRDAFLSDVEFGGDPGGPTGYDDYEFHKGYGLKLIVGKEQIPEFDLIIYEKNL